MSSISLPKKLMYMKLIVLGILIVTVFSCKKDLKEKSESSESKEQIVEFAMITLKDGVSEEMLLKASLNLQNDFLQKQPGFLKRELLKSSPKEYVDLIYWESQKSADDAVGKAMESPVCLSFFELMEEADINDPAEGVAYYKVVNEYEWKLIELTITGTIFFWENALAFFDHSKELTTENQIVTGWGLETFFSWNRMLASLGDCPVSLYIKEETNLIKN